jgi:hypothetical protein
MKLARSVLGEGTGGNGTRKPKVTDGAAVGAPTAPNRPADRAD